MEAEDLVKEIENLETQLADEKDRSAELSEENFKVEEQLQHVS